MAVNIVCGQIPGFTGTTAQGEFPLAKAINVVIHPGRIDVASLLTGLGALAILLVMSWTRGRVASALVALVVPTVVVVVAGATSVARVGDVGDIPPARLHAVVVQPDHPGHWRSRRSCSSRVPG